MGKFRPGRARAPLALIGSQVVGQLALVAVLPVLTRVYPPAEFGVYQFAFAIAFILLPLATLRLEYIVPTTHAAELVRRRLRLGTAVALGLSLLLIAVGVIDHLSGLTDVSGILIMTGLLVPALGLPLLDGARLVRQGARRALAVRNLVGGVAGASLQAVFALSGGDVTLLPVALLAGRLIGIAASRLVKEPATGERSMDAAARSDGSAETADPELEPARDTPYTLARALPTIGAGAMSGLTIQGLTVIAGATVGPAAAGQVGVAQRIASTPISLAGQALAQVTQLSFSRIIREQRPSLTASLGSHVRAFLALGVLVGAALAIGGPLLAGPVLGEEWAPAGVLIAMLAIPATLQVAVSPTDFLFVMLGRERRLFALQFTRAALTWTTGLVAAALTGDIGVVVLSFSIAWALAYALSLVFVFRAARTFDREHRANAAPPVTAAADASPGAATGEPASTEATASRAGVTGESRPAEPGERTVFAAMTGDYPNIGDAIIRRETLEWVHGIGPVHTYVGRAPDAWIDQIGAAPLGPVYRRRPGAQAWIRALLTTPRPVLLFEPGEVQLESRHVVRELVFLALGLAVKARRGTIVYAPRALARISAPSLWVYRMSARLADFSPMREQASFELVPGAVRSPDIAFARDAIPTGEPGPSGAARDTLVISLRGARAFPPDAWLAGVRSFAGSRGLRIVVSAQVRGDEARADELAAALDAEAFGWGSVPDLVQERRLLSLYERATVVLSDRLHVLILAASCGAIPLELVAGPSGKVRAHFAWVGVHEVSVEATGMDAVAVAAAIESAASRSPYELTAALTGARAEVRHVRARARALMSPLATGATAPTRVSSR
ncbi:polysaccharide pyruvyl transferase family protein [Microbacterium sp. HA-8]|uniref:polysaccharide pyruvyl transferase family protein n=1 Tax=Microbacterium sp. HA-8 TaxID=3234200 RepID=UPI0038F63312